MIPYSVLDLAPILEGATVKQSFANSLELAQHAERLGYTRYWLAEHHNMPGIASSATSVVIGHVAAGTSSIRVGSGGIMLPNHAPLIVAEQFGTLATLHGDRIDLGIGRAPGTDGATAHALRRGMQGADRFPQDVLELLSYLEEPQPGQHVKAIPGAGTRVPVWILGSSLYGAQLAAQLGLPYAFASHFAPDALEEASDVYRRGFQPSPWLDAPYFMMAVNVFAAETDEDGRILKSSMQQSMANLRTGRPGPLPRPVADIEALLGLPVATMVDQIMRVSVHGASQTVRDGLAALIGEHRPDEIIINGAIHDHAARLRSFEIAADAMQSMATPAAAE